MIDPSFITTLSSMIAFEITQLEPTLTLLPIITFFFKEKLIPISNFLPILTLLSINVFLLKNFLYFLFKLKL